MSPASTAVLGVDFGAPRRARAQRRKIIAIATSAVADGHYRVDAIGMNERLLANRPFDACTAAGITLDVDSRLRALCCYTSGGKTPDDDAADAFIALCTAILHAEGTCRMAIDGDAFVKGSEGTIWVRRIACRS